MSNNLQVISDTLRNQVTQGKLMLTLGHQKPTAEAKNDVKKYCASVLAEVEKSYGGKNDLTTCSPDSIVKCMIDAARFRIMIDGRQHAHLIKYGNQAQLQLGYRGYIAKICEHFDSADITVFPVFKGDTLDIKGQDGFESYDYSRGKPFPKDEDFEGVCAALYYKKGGREFQKVITMSSDEIGKVRAVAKQDFIWKGWFLEKAKVAAIKRLCKTQFAGINEIQNMISYDNQNNFDMNKPNVNDSARNILDSLNSEIDSVIPKEEKPAHDTDSASSEDDVIDVESEEIETIESEMVNEDGSVII